MQLLDDLTDFAQLQSTMHAIEIACTSVQMNENLAAAERTILSLHQSRKPYNACQFILENSQVSNARFHAAAAIRDAAMREWCFLADEEKKSLMSFCLSYITQYAGASEDCVQAKVSSVAAQILKRGWVDFTVSEKETIFNQVKQSVMGLHGVDGQYSGIMFLESLVSEFSADSLSSMGVPREFHEHCHVSFQQDYLKVFYCWARDAAMGLSCKLCGSSDDVPDAKVAAAALSLMSQILSWDFNYDSHSIKDGNTSFKQPECILVQPGPAWRDVLISSSHVGWLLNFYASLRERFSRGVYWIDCPLAVSARKLIIRFFSLTGSIFVSDGGQTQKHHFLQLFSGIIQWVDPPEVILDAIKHGRGGSEFLDGCHALFSLATVVSPVLFDQLTKLIRPFGILTLLFTLMFGVINALATNETDEETWSWQARDILLDIWTLILVKMNGGSVIELFHSEGMKAIADLFVLIVEAELRGSAASALENSNDCECFQASLSAMDDRLTSYALIGRASLDLTLPFLLRLLRERFAHLHQGRSFDPNLIMEETCFLLLITGYVIADEGEGETPLIPSAIQKHFEHTREGDEHSITLLSTSIITFAETSLNPDTRASIFSPRLMEAVIWFLARWMLTYLMSDAVKDFQRYPDQLETRVDFVGFFGEHNQGKLVLDIIVRISLSALLSYPGEKDLQALTCRQLLNAVIRRKCTRIHLFDLESWHQLANAFAHENILFKLDSANQCLLAEVLVLSASGMKNPEASNRCVRDLMGHAIKYLAELCTKSNVETVAQLPDVTLTVRCLLERLCGAANATEPRTYRAIYEIGYFLMSPLLSLLDVYRHESAVIYQILKFIVCWVGGLISYLDVQEIVAVISFCTQLLQIYSAHNIGKIQVSSSSRLVSQESMGKYKELRVLLHLLSNLCSRDLVDFSSDSHGAQGTNISQIIYFGIHIITPLIPLELLKYPKLCHDYFSLLSHLLEVYPQMVVQLSTEAVAHIFVAVEFGLQHQDTEVINLCLRALRAIASYHHEETSGGREGLGSCAAAAAAAGGGMADSHGNCQQGILGRFLQLLLQFLLFKEYSADLVGPAADALFPLILSEQALFQEFANGLTERQQCPEHRARLSDAWQALANSNQLSSTLDRINYQRFRKNLCIFLANVRGFLLII